MMEKGRLAVQIAKLQNPLTPVKLDPNIIKFLEVPLLFTQGHPI